MGKNVNAGAGVGENKVRITNLREKDEFYNYWWSKGKMHPRRTALVDKKEYAIFKRQKKNQNAQVGFLLSG